MLCLSRTLSIVVLLLISFTYPETAHAHAPSSESALPNKPFLAVWQAKTSRCLDDFGVNLSLSSYGIVHNKNETWWGESVTTMGKIGLYPYYDRNTSFHHHDNATAHNGGIPQLGNLTAHLEQVMIDIQECIPDKNFNGLGIIDWEEWKPVWERNYASRQVYQNKSIELVQSCHPDWSADQVVAMAVKEFELSARLWMEKTIALVKLLRPQGLWGYYEFPNCFNDVYDSKYGYHCLPDTISWNDQIQWLFNASTVLYPSIYLYHVLTNNSRHVKYNLLEALRVDGNRDADVPIFSYVLYKYGHTHKFISFDDLVTTVGQSVYLGMSGVVFWGDGTEEASYKLCVELKDYVQEILGPLVRNVTQEAEQCSKRLCSGNGRCFIPSDDSKSSRQMSNTSNFLGFNWMDFSGFIQCRCYPGWSGPRCGETPTCLQQSI